MRQTIRPVMLGLLLAAAGTLGAAGTLQAQEQAAQVVASVTQTRVNLNHADAQTLSRELNGIGPAKAQAIIDYRSANGPFQTVDELIEVKGIGVSTLERLRPQLSVD